MTRLVLFASLVIALAACSTSSDDSNTDTGSVNPEVAALDDTVANQDIAAAEDTAPTDGVQAPADVAAAGDVPALLAFGETCVEDTDCESSVCHDFGALGPTCTIPCESPDDCPEGSEGQKCNNKGVCKP
jgi:hypothetical protein